MSHARSDVSMSIANPLPPHTGPWQKFFAAIGMLGVLIMIVALAGISLKPAGLYLCLSIGLMALGSIGYAAKSYLSRPAGVRNEGNYFSGLVNRGIAGWSLGILLTGFYVLLYWFPGMLGLGEETNTGLVGLFDPLSFWLKGSKADQWFVYGSLYTMAICYFGVRFYLKYRHSRYQKIRTISVMFFQVCFAFTLPMIMERLNRPSMDLKNIWPLNYSFFFEWNIDQMLANGTFGLFLLFWGIALTILITPILTYFYGKRWYCSWVCGCGGLAETAGDPFRHLSDKSLRAWKIERWMVHGVLVFVVFMTAFVLYTYFTGDSKLLGLDSEVVRSIYGFLIGAIFSGVVGVGFYPLMGSRVWCRFGCPMAAYLGILQKYFSRFRITANGSQCISCGNCSTYCEMGIDVKWYAQRGQDIVRASCVGCGICSEVCPRGVLRLENGSVDLFSKASPTRAVHIGEDEVRRLD